MKGRLLLHTLGEAADGAFLRQGEDLPQPLKKGIIKGGVDVPVEPAHILQGCGGVVENIIGDVADFGLGLRVFKYRLPGESHAAAVRAVDAGDVADGGGFARAVGAYQAVYRALGHVQGQIVQGKKAVKGLADVL